MSLTKSPLRSYPLAFILLYLAASVSFAQQTASSDPNAGSPATSKAKPVPGLDMKTGIPLYETIHEDWSSLQIGTSQLEPIPPVVGATDEQPTYTRILVQVAWRPGDPIDLYIILPKGVKKPPAVLYVYGHSENNDRFRDDGWCLRATSGGVAAVGFVSALTGDRFHDRPLKQWFVSQLQESLGSTVHDVKFILDYLAKRGDIDMKRVGIFGEGSGGTIAILAAAADPRIRAVDALDPWGDWPQFLAKSPIVLADPNHAKYVTPEFLKKVAPLDPVKWLPKLKVPVRVQLVRENGNTPLSCKEKIAAAVPKQGEVARFEDVSALGKRENRGRLFDWIKDRLQASDKSEAVANARKIAALQAPKAQPSH